MNCPLCGQPNACGIKAVHETQSDCWCFHEQFPEALLQQLPVDMRGKACICKSCLHNHLRLPAREEEQPH
ncbi:cysteine-rich CWC family protein [Paenibacillus endophyticus]|uniref:cysteine-rich CWC family protein n=1 Tax=Paenibacillus endophyticus TaxID=1294268 RepID=UPI0016223619